MRYYHKVCIKLYHNYFEFFATFNAIIRIVICMWIKARIKGNWFEEYLKLIIKFVIFRLCSHLSPVVCINCLNLIISTENNAYFCSYHLQARKIDLPSEFSWLYVNLKPLHKQCCNYFKNKSFRHLICLSDKEKLNQSFIKYIFSYTSLAYQNILYNYTKTNKLNKYLKWCGHTFINWVKS